MERFTGQTCDPAESAEELLSFADRLRPMLMNTTAELNHALDCGKTVVFEAGQAVMLDIDHGTYPFVTSSSCSAAGACTGSGVGPRRIDRVVGVSKAYLTRVGEGPFPTELTDGEGDWLREAGREYGVTTGRPRRCGWYDAVVARYATMVNSLTDMVITKLDVLTGKDRIPVCTAYEADGKRMEDMPALQSEMHRVRPVYEYLPGWEEDISGCRNFTDLPPERTKLYSRPGRTLRLPHFRSRRRTGAGADNSAYAFGLRPAPPADFIYSVSSPARRVSAFCGEKLSKKSAGCAFSPACGREKAR